MKLISICLFFSFLFLDCYAQEEECLPVTKAEFARVLEKAGKGDVKSKYIVACCYLDGIPGVLKKSREKGKEYLLQATEEYYPEACMKMYKLDPYKNLEYRTIAEKIFREQGTGYAYYCIAEMYNTKPEKSHQWLKASKMMGYKKADEQLLRIYKRQKTSDSYNAWYKQIPQIENLGNIVQTEPDKQEESRKDFTNFVSEVDMEIPVTSKLNDHTIALVIGNENYKRVVSVPYAKNDAKIFSEYCKKTLGIDEKNVIYMSNATAGEMGTSVSRIAPIMQGMEKPADIIFYYAGHGIPDEINNKPYLLPIDADGVSTKFCYGIEQLINDLQSLKANSVTVFLDACFSGAQRGDGMITNEGTRSIVRKAKPTYPQEKMVVFSSSSADQTSWPIKEKGHGLFTYFLLKKMKESAGNVTLGELGDYIKKNVSRESAYNKTPQTPTVVPSPDIQQTWRNKTLK